MKFLALLVAAVVATDETPAATPAAGEEAVADATPGKAPEGGACDATKADMGCADGFQCQTAPPTGVNTCIATAKCGVADTATPPVTTTCGAKALAASAFAALAIAATM